MSRKQYREVAEIIKGAYSEHFDTELTPHYAQGWVLAYVASGLAAMFELDNDNFDRDKFMAACFPPSVE